jgi:cystathionine beta-lyase
LQKNNVILVSDEIHSDLVFSGHKHIPIGLPAAESDFETLYCAVSPTKTFNIAGLSVSCLNNT